MVKVLTILGTVRGEMGIVVMIISEMVVEVMIKIQNEKDMNNFP